MKYYSHASYYHATHEVLLVYSAQNIACVQYMEVDLHAAHFVSHSYYDWATQQKLKNTCMFSASTCTWAVPYYIMWWM